MHLPLIDNLAVLEIHTEERVGVIAVLHDHVAIFSMQHDLLGVEHLAVWCFDLGDAGRELEMIVGSVLEDTNLGASDDE